MSLVVLAESHWHQTLDAATPCLPSFPTSLKLSQDNIDSSSKSQFLASWWGHFSMNSVPLICELLSFLQISWSPPNSCTFSRPSWPRVSINSRSSKSDIPNWDGCPASTILILLNQERPFLKNTLRSIPTELATVRRREQHSLWSLPRANLWPVLPQNQKSKLVYRSCVLPIVRFSCFCKTKNDPY